MPSHPHWNETAKARAFLDRIDLDDLYIAGTHDVRPDALVLTGEPVAALEEMRRKHVAKLIGMTFTEALQRGLERVWMRHFNAQPEVQDVLTDRFGPLAFSYGRSAAYCHEITRQWREIARQRIERHKEKAHEAARKHAALAHRTAAKRAAREYAALARSAAR